MTSYAGAVQTNGYDGDGLRAWMQEGTTKTYFLYDGTDPVCEFTSTGTLLAVNTFGTDHLVSRHTSSGSVFYTFDERGNVSQRLNSSGAVQSSDLHDSYGARNSTGGADVWGFEGQAGYYTDSETSLIQCTHRFYDPATGRFVTRDPIGYDGGINLYGYVGNNPINRLDPIGLRSITIGVSGTFVFGLPIGIGASAGGGIVIGDGGIGVYGSIIGGVGVGIVGSVGGNFGYSSAPQLGGFHGGPIYGWGGTADLGAGGSLSYCNPFSGSGGPGGLSGWKGGPSIGGGIGG